jgi:hypothetical protein
MRRALTYGDGIATGLAVIAIAAACYLSIASLRLVPMYAEFGDVVLPGVTRLVLHPAWLYGVPVALISALVVLHVRRPRHGIAALAVIATGFDVFWYWAAWAPVHALAGNIAG